MKTLRAVLLKRNKKCSVEKTTPCSILTVELTRGSETNTTLKRTKRITLEQSKQVKQRNTDQVLAMMMEDELLHDTVNLFCLREHSHENMLIYDAIYAYKKLKDSCQRRIAATEMYEKYLAKGAPIEVNVNWSVKELVKELMRSMENKWEVSPDLFIEVERAIVENLLDVIARFVKSEEYQAYKAEDLKKLEIQQSNARKRISMFFRA
jgi:hypothetical protein